MSVSTAAAAPQTTTKTRAGRAARIVGWILRILLAATFVNAAVPKFAADPMVAAGFTDLGGNPMMYAVAVLEVAGAIGLLIPILSGLASIGLTALLAIITVVTVLTVGPAMLAMPVGCLIVASVLVYLQRGQTVRVAHVARQIVSPT